MRRRSAFVGRVSTGGSGGFEGILRQLVMTINTEVT